MIKNENGMWICTKCSKKFGSIEKAIMHDFVCQEENTNNSLGLKS